MKELIIRVFCVVSACFMSLSAEAQTSLIQNGDFEGAYSVYATPRSDREIYQPDGWTVSYSNGEENDMSCMGDGSKQWDTFKGLQQPANGGSKAYWIRFRWGNSESLAISQNVKLPEGSYVLSCDAFTNGTTGTATISVAGKSVQVDSRSAWATYMLAFAVAKETDITVSLSFSQNGAQADSRCGFDNVKLVQYDGDATDLSWDMTGVMANPSFELGTETSNANTINIPYGYTIEKKMEGWLDGVCREDNNVTDGTKCYNAWAGNIQSFDMYQKVTLPQGRYTLSADIYTDVVNGQCIYAVVDGVEYKSNLLPKNAEVTNVSANFFVPYNETQVRLGTKSSAWYKIDNFRLTYHGLAYLGDANNDGDVTTEDVASFVEELKKGANGSFPVNLDVDKNGVVDKNDVDALADIITKGTKSKCGNADPMKALVCTEQLNSENVSGPEAQITSVTSATSDTDLSAAFTKIKVNVTGISDVESVSIYAKGKETIAGNLIYNMQSKAFSVSDGKCSSAYALGMLSDVVTVKNDNSSSDIIAYLLPVELSNGVTVTVRTKNDTYYTQDFSVNANEVNNLTFTNTTASGAWMATVPGDIHFNYLSIPGAHDAATSGCTSMTNWTTCQSMTIPELLKAGVRSLDLRPYGGKGITIDNMYINHGDYTTNILFKTALINIKNYLAANPTETVFVLMHDEKGDNADDWKKAVLDGLDLVKDYIKVIDNNMTLDDCRGKMVIISRDNVGSTNLLGKCGWGSSFGDKTVFYGQDTNNASPWVLVYQDEYKTTNTTNRIGQVEDLLTKYVSPNATNKNRIYVNTTNIAGISSISSYAKTMNNAIATSTTFTSCEGRYGIISSDFIADSTYNGDKLLRLIIDQNYKYIYKGRSRVTK